jgi:large subunit ribosomal protein L7/L12
MWRVATRSNLMRRGLNVLAKNRFGASNNPGVISFRPRFAAGRFSRCFSVNEAGETGDAGKVKNPALAAVKAEVDDESTITLQQVVEKELELESAAAAQSEADDIDPSEIPFMPGTPGNWDPKIEDLVNQIGALNLFEVAEFAECLRVKLNIPDVPMGMMMAGGAADDDGDDDAKKEAPVEERHVFDVKLEKFEAKAKIKIIKELRSMTDLGLKEAKALVESAPCFIKKDVPKAEAEVMKEKLSELGGEILLE